MTAASPLVLAVVYLGLAGAFAALVVATAQQKWSCRVFFLLALRLAIGWHFLFEGLHKIHSHHVGPTETNRPFSSEPYFRVAPGPVGALMRKQFDDPAEVINTKLKPPKAGMTGELVGMMSVEQQAAECPGWVVERIDAVADLVPPAVKAEAAKELKDADAAEKKAMAAAAAAEEYALVQALVRGGPDFVNAARAVAKVAPQADEDRKKAKDAAEKARRDARKKDADFQQVAAERIVAAKAYFARWVYGAEGRPTKVKFVTGDVYLSAPQRLQHIAWMRKEVEEADARRSAGLGTGNATEQKRAAELRTELVAAESDLAKDTLAFVVELRSDLSGGKAVEEPLPPRLGDRMDKMTMWFLVVVGACLMAGLFTRVACLLAAGFLVMTYLAHPAFPWYPLPPNTEGNPVFVNKNVIECLALLALATLPTGRWLGLDAIVMRVCCRGKPEEQPAA